MSFHLVHRLPARQDTNRKIALTSFTDTFLLVLVISTSGNCGSIKNVKNANTRHKKSKGSGHSLSLIERYKRSAEMKLKFDYNKRSCGLGNKLPCKAWNHSLTAVSGANLGSLEERRTTCMLKSIVRLLSSCWTVGVAARGRAPKVETMALSRYLVGTMLAYFILAPD